MKKIFLTLTILIGLCAGCKDSADLLDPVSTTGLNKEVVFSDQQYSERFLLDIYRQILPVLLRTDNAGGRWRTLSLLETTTELGSYNATGRHHNFNTGSYDASSGELFSHNDWREMYAAIRGCNLYLESADKIPLNAQANFTEAVRNTRKAEAKWLLAFNYAELLKEFGGVPIIEGIVDPESTPMPPRSTYEQTLNYVVKLCDEAAAVLPLQQPDQDLGRATKGAALALKARMLLYAASPLWNDPAKASPAANEAAYYIPYNASRWVAAAQAAQAVIALGQYQLHNDISTLFITRTNNEIIFARMQEPMAYFSATNTPYKLYTGAGAYVVGAGPNQVTYNMVKEYEVLKGGVAYSITDAASGYNPQDPYKNLDPRFYRDCIYNGAKARYANVDKVAEFGEVAAGVNKTPAHNMLAGAYNTHVFSTKFCDRSLNITWDARNAGAGQRTNQNYPYLRYAEVLLSYAEAANEISGPDAVPAGVTGATLTARQALNLVRERAKYPANNATTNVEYLGYTGGMPPIASGLSKDQFRTKLQHERKVEFSYEEHWFWDFRRWKLTPETDIKAQIPVWTSPTTVTYQLRTIMNRYWDPKLYRMPIPQAEILLNTNLVQNPGW